MFLLGSTAVLFEDWGFAVSRSNSDVRRSTTYSFYKLLQPVDRPCARTRTRHSRQFAISYNKHPYARMPANLYSYPH
eukprot:scaffold173365_cov31-Prasinocladus_malaysianus.AAC.1